MKYLSVFDTDKDILLALSDIHLRGKWYDLDCTFSKGVFYKDIPEPKFKSDINPTREDIEEASADNLWFVDSVSSIIFDPPFLFRNRKSINNDKMSGRFTYFKTYEDLIDMYTKSIVEFSNKLNKGGYLFFKCQDMTDNKFYATHCEVIKIAEDNGFVLKDIAIKRNKTKLQREAKQQNCVAKVHSYWLVFKSANLLKILGGEK